MALAGSLDADSFLDEYWQKRPLRLPAGCPSGMPELSPDELGWLATLDDVESRLVFTESTRRGSSYRVLHGPFASRDLERLPRENWTIYGSVGYADAEYDEYEIDEFTDNSGNTLARAPEWTASLGTQVDWSFTDYFKGMFRLDYSYQDEFFTQANNDPFFAADSQNIVNARLQLSDTDQTWAATLWGRNLTDDDNINTIDGPSTFFFPTYHYSLIAPRTYGVELQYNF